MPAAIAFADDQRRQLDPRTPEGLHNIILAQTGDTTLAEKALTEARVQQTFAGLQGTTI